MGGFNLFVVMKVSVILPTYNRPNMVWRAIDSFFIQDYHKRELVVLDGDVSGDTLKVLKRYGNNIKVFRHDNKNFIKSFNQVWNDSDSDLICQLHDDDTFYDHRSISSRVQEFEKNKSLEVLYAGVVEKDINGNYLATRPPIPTDVNKLLQHDYINFTTMMWRNEVKEKFMFSGDFFYQCDLFFKLQCLINCNHTYINDLVMNYTIHAGQFSDRSVINKETELLKVKIKELYGI